MPQPSIKIQGVYRLPVTKKLIEEQLQNLYPHDMSRQSKQYVKRQLESCVLIEVLVKNRDDVLSCRTLLSHATARLPTVGKRRGLRHI